MKYFLLYIFSIIFRFYSLDIKKSKICINCKYFIPNINDNKLGKCSLFPKEEGIIDYLVSGVNNNVYYYCSNVRSAPNMCGKEGRLYEEKSKNETLK
jgi:hypothetical protein